MWSIRRTIGFQRWASALPTTRLVSVVLHGVLEEARALAMCPRGYNLRLGAYWMSRYKPVLSTPPRSST
eukprot:3395959-Lingulodinium_polyedra.AAC.1